MALLLSTENTQRYIPESYLVQKSYSNLLVRCLPARNGRLQQQGLSMEVGNPERIQSICSEEKQYIGVYSIIHFSVANNLTGLT